VFDAPEGMDVDLEEDWPTSGRLVLDRRSRMLYRGKQLFINGETAMTPVEAALRTLADARSLDCADPACAKLSDDARSCLADWLDSGWIRYVPA
jgi:50S ribosomal protein L16 3-hydroxylase